MVIYISKPRPMDSFFDMFVLDPLPSEVGGSAWIGLPKNTNRERADLLLCTGSTDGEVQDPELPFAVVLTIPTVFTTCTTRAQSSPTGKFIYSELLIANFVLSKSFKIIIKSLKYDLSEGVLLLAFFFYPVHRARKVVSESA